jgi:N-acetylmuramic acid 6-phosphate etherase
VHGAIRRAKQLGAATVFFACVTREQVGDEADVSIRVLTGPELITGSTRLKAGTATKMVLNMISTIAMVQLGKVYENLMVDVNTRANAKLVDRGTRIIQELTGLEREEAGALLEAAAGHSKVALVMHARSVDLITARRLLDESQGQLAQAMNTRETMT